MEEHRVRLTDKERVTDEILFLTYTYPESFDFEAGQYVNLELDVDGTTRYRPYSLYSHPDNDTLVFCVKLVDNGFASTYFKNVSEGASVPMHGPIGQFTLDTDQTNHVFLATGAGIAPLHSMIKEAITNDADTIELYHGIPTREDTIATKTLERLARKHDCFSFTQVYSREDTGTTGYVQDHAPIRDDASYYLCGVKEFVEDTEATLRDSGVPEALINRERFS